MLATDVAQTAREIVAAKLDASELPEGVLHALERSYPQLKLCPFNDASPTATIDVRDWSSGRTLLEFDRGVHRAEDRARESAGDVILRILPANQPPDRLLESCCQIVTRYQRLFLRTNQNSRGRLFRQLLERFAALHALEKPLVRADFDHALDVWQWTLTLEPGASCALQIAALFHDVERLSSEADQRVEQRASDYNAFKREHARKGAQWLLAELLGRRWPSEVSVRAHDLVQQHETPSQDAELICLNDADALSFFALNSEGYLAYFGREQTRKKVYYTLERMSDPALARLGSTRLPHLVREFASDWAVQT